MTGRLAGRIVAIDSDHLRTLVRDAIKKQGPRCNLNNIDVSQITDMRGMFVNKSFDGDISRWNTKNVIMMSGMFKGSQFNGNLTGWNVSRVVDMDRMFEDSHFNKDISRWSVGGVANFTDMFARSRFSGNLSGWRLAPDARTQGMLGHRFDGVAPRDLGPQQWSEAFSGGAPEHDRYFKRAPFVPGMTWWLHLAHEQPFSDAVPKGLHRWLRDAQALGRELRMPRLDVATLLSLGYPMGMDKRAELHRKFQAHYVTSSAMVDLLRPDGKLDYDTWLFGVPKETQHRFALVLAGANPGVATPESFEMFELPQLQ